MTARDRTISVCIPTCDRAALLPIAVASCLDQNYRPIEILIGDDSGGNETENWIAAFAAPEGITLRYRRNRPALGQSENVNRLLDSASGDRLILLHDDDRLLPGGIDLLVEAWNDSRCTRCVYGRQLIVDAAGFELPERTAAWNNRYFRNEIHAGTQAVALVAALRQQVPNDGYLVDSQLARSVGCRPESRIGQCIDADFMIRLSQSVAAGGFVFINTDISEYRLTPLSIARRKDLNRREDLLFEAVEALSGDTDIQSAKTLLLSRISVGAALDAAMAGRRWLALQNPCSSYYPKPLMSRWTLYRLVCAGSPQLGRRLKHYADSLLKTLHPGGVDP